jgi:hypothetical protein
MEVEGYNLTTKHSLKILGRMVMIYGSCNLLLPITRALNKSLIMSLRRGNRMYDPKMGTPHHIMVVIMTLQADIPFCKTPHAGWGACTAGNSVS